MKRILYIYLLVAISAVLAGCNSSEPSHSTIPETAKARVVESRREPTPVIVRATGTLHARQSVSVSAQVVARVQQMLVKEGDSVRAGQMLAVLDDATLRDSEDQTEAAVKAAEHERAVAQSNADLAASTLARYKQLQSQKSVSPQEFD
jgi:multidrug efflux pump subunit AcrA (membrane-fusion protein)